MRPLRCWSRCRRPRSTGGWRATGNIANAALLALIEANVDAIVGTPGEADFVELEPVALVVHRRRGDGSTS